MEQIPIQIGAISYYVKRKFVGDRLPKELIFEKIVESGRIPLDKTSNIEL